MKIVCLAASASSRGVLLFTLLASITGAQSQTWLRQFGTASTEEALAAAPDGFGGVYLSGYTYGSLGGPNGGGGDAWLAHHDRTGNQTWIRQFGSTSFDTLRAAAPDGAGGVYVGGDTWGSLGGPNGGSLDAWVAHYDGAGNQTWIRQFGSFGDDHGVAVAPDGSGGVYVGGYTLGSVGGPTAGSSDALLAHYDGAGNQTWIRQFGTTDTDVLIVAAADGAGGVYVSGWTTGSLGGPNAGTSDAWLARYDGAGNQTWVRQFGTTSGDVPLGAAVDGVGGLFLGGFTGGDLGGPSNGGGDAWLARYDSAGNQNWIRQLGTTDYDELLDVTSDQAGGVYVSGATQGSLGGPNAGSTDAWLAHHDGAGHQLWIQQFGTSEADSAHAVASDGAGGLYVSGATSGSLGGPNAGPRDAWIAHFDGLVATRYCTPAIQNSTGVPGVLTATGSNAVVANNLTVIANQLPQHSFGVFLTSLTQGVTASPGGSQGDLCLGGSIGLFDGPGQVQNVGPGGTASLALRLNAWPAQSAVVQPGQTWNFQAWYRDANPGPTSNFTDAVAVTFR